MTDLEKNPSYQLGRLESAVEEAVVRLIDMSASPIAVARYLVKAIGGPDDLSADQMLDWITERRGG